MTGSPARRLAGGVLAAGVAASVIFGAVSPAAATESDGILVSADGVHFASALEAGLFDDLGRVNSAVNGENRAWIIPIGAVLLFSYAGYMMAAGAIGAAKKRRRQRS